jgi:hypothetical protein
MRTDDAMKSFPWLFGFCSLLAGKAHAAVTATILAGGETDLPADTPSGRLDRAGEFSFVGALVIASGGGNYKGSGVALSRDWVLTAAHNVDLNDDGRPDASWSGSFNLPGYGSFGIAQAFTHPAFTGFANPSINDDLARCTSPARCLPACSIPGWAQLARGTSSRWSASGAPATAAMATRPKPPSRTGALASM